MPIIFILFIFVAPLILTVTKIQCFMNNEIKFEGSYVESFVDGRVKRHLGDYFVTELKTRYKVSFRPFGYEFPLFVDFVILKSRKRGFSVVTDWINNNWN